MKNFQFSIFNFQKERGFTLVETLVAVTILALSVSAAFTAAQVGLSSSTISKDGMIAFYLAQEGVEEIRNIRDENGLRVRSWLTGLDSCINANCKIDSVTHDLPTSCGGSCPPLKQTSEGFFGYDASGTDTNFTRTITMAPVNGNEYSITVTVAWHKGIVERTFKARENILNWQ